MAKSMRSKFRRKMRAEKRVKNSVRDLERLNRLAQKGLTYLAEQGGPSTVSDLTSHVVLPPLKSGTEGEGETMDTTKAQPVIRNKKTLRDENGHYPVWVGKKQVANIRKQVKQRKASKKRKAQQKKSKF